MNGIPPSRVHVVEVPIGPGWAWMYCPRCHATNPTETDRRDPTGTKVIVCPCPDCAPDGPDSIRWLAEDGAVLLEVSDESPVPLVGSIN